MSQPSATYPVTVVSLTAAGRALAERLRPSLPHETEYLYRPTPFGQSLRDRFCAGRRLVIIAATGIAVRTLAPSLKDKHRDPPVLVLDEHGRYVVPLLSGHEGGANAWGRDLARAIGAQCVVTGAETYHRMLLVAGMGCERHCPAQTLAELLDGVLARHGISAGEVQALASIDIKRDESGLNQLAAQLGVPIAYYPASRLLSYTDRLTERSDIVYRETGCYGVAEAAALAHAETLAGGAAAELLVSKQKNARATIALARAPLSEDSA